MTDADNAKKLIPTPSQTVGPYFHLGLTDLRSIARIACEGVKGERIWITFRVWDGDGLPVPDALIELWQADSDGNYSSPEHLAKVSNEAAFRGFGRMPTGEDGACTFETIKPGPIPGPGNALQAPHINVSVLGRGLLNRLSTRTYFAGESSNASDPILALVPASRRATLLARPDAAREGGWIFDVRLCGEGETVFFDV
jgi:protocatechuate 3,4-dioxygenase, alpha subunit